jgi:hypothetical protein
VSVHKPYLRHYDLNESVEVSTNQSLAYYAYFAQRFALIICGL